MSFSYSTLYLNVKLNFSSTEVTIFNNYSLKRQDFLLIFLNSDQLIFTPFHSTYFLLA